MAWRFQHPLTLRGIEKEERDEEGRGEERRRGERGRDSGRMKRTQDKLKKAKCFTISVISVKISYLKITSS